MAWTFIAIMIVAFLLLRCLDSTLSGDGLPHTPSVDSSFKMKWPAISDGEFMGRCTPGADRETALKTRRIVSEQLGIPYDHVYPEQNFVNDLGCD